MAREQERRAAKWSAAERRAGLHTADEMEQAEERTEFERRLQEFASMMRAYSNHDVFVRDSRGYRVPSPAGTPVGSLHGGEAFMKEQRSARAASPTSPTAERGSGAKAVKAAGGQPSVVLEEDLRDQVPIP